MRLWIEWFRCVRQLRGSCSRSRTFAWLVLVLAAVSTRLDLAGVTSFVRALRLSPSAYRRLLHLFHSSALSLDHLTALWVQLVLRVFSPYTVGPYLVCLADGVKAPKEGRKMPAVKSLHQEADTNSKPPFIMGHSFQAISLLVRSASGHIAERGLCQAAPSPIPGESHTTLQYCWFDLLWRPVGHEVRFVVVKHPLRGVIILMTTDTDLDLLDAVVLYSHRFKIETGFRHAIHVLGSYAYHFWMEEMDPIRRRSGDQHLHMKSEEYRRGVRRKMQAYHAHVQIGCIAQGLLIHLAVNHGEQVWKQFRSWLRTMDPTRPPSELVVAYSLREALPEFLEEGPKEHALRNILR